LMSSCILKFEFSFETISQLPYLQLPRMSSSSTVGTSPSPCSPATWEKQLSHIEKLLEDDPTNEYLLNSKERVEGYIETNLPVNSMLPVTDTDFVPEGFHENCREEDGTIKVTKKNRQFYQDNDHLVKMYKSGQWGCEKGVTYTSHEAQCPDGRVPKVEAITSLALRKDITFRGRIVCEDGKVYDADTENTLQEIARNPGHPTNQKIANTFQNIMSFHFSIPPNYQYEKSFVVDYNGAQKYGIPEGNYKEKERCFKIGVDGLAMFSLCDQPDCCLMNHAMLPAMASGCLPVDMKNVMKDYFKNRKMYKMEDDINGNFDICYHCIQEAATETL